MIFNFFSCNLEFVDVSTSQIKRIWSLQRRTLKKGNKLKFISFFSLLNCQRSSLDSLRFFKLQYNLYIHATKLPNFSLLGEIGVVLFRKANVTNYFINHQKESEFVASFVCLHACKFQWFYYSNVRVIPVCILNQYRFPKDE